MSSRLVNTSGGGRSRSFFARFKDVDDKAKQFILEDAQGNEIRVGPDYQMEKAKREEGIDMKPSQVALRRFASSTSERHLDVIATEQPWVRVAGMRSNNTCYDIKKVKTRYSKAVGEARSDEARALERKKTQDGRRSVTGLGRGRIYQTEKGTITASVDFIPEGRGPADAEPFAGGDVYDRIKALYKAHYKPGMRQNFVFSSGPIDGESFGVAPLLAPNIEDEHQPDARYTVKRPLKPAEFDKYVDEVRDGMVSPNDKLGNVLQRVADKGGEWKAVGGYALRFRWDVVNPKDPSNRPGKSIVDDVRIGRELRAKGSVAIDNWRTPMETLRSYAGTTIMGRAGMLHDGFVPMSLVLSRDPFTKHVCVDDATMATAPGFPCDATLVADPESIEDWHEGRAREVEPTLELLVPPRERNNGAAPRQQAQHQETAEEPGMNGLGDPDESPADAPTPQDAWDGPGIELDDEHVPF